MQDGQNDARALWALGLERRVQFARGQWWREEDAGAIRSAGWWESVTITWSQPVPPISQLVRSAQAVPVLPHQGTGRPPGSRWMRLGEVICQS